MGSLILCRQNVAAMPFYLEDVSLNLYTLEEISYFIKENTDLAKQEFEKQEFLNWLEQQLQMPILAQRLELYRNRKNIPLFFEALLRASGYLREEEIQVICQNVEEFQNKTEVECCKIRADRLLGRRKYASAVLEYKKILKMAEWKEEDGVFQGNVLNNLGTAYASLFLYELAEGCYEKAYALNLSPETGREYWYAALMARGEDQTKEKMRQQNMEPSAIEQFFATVVKRREQLEQDAMMTELEHVRENGEVTQFQREADRILELWKEEYRRNCVF